MLALALLAAEVMDDPTLVEVDDLLFLFVVLLLNKVLSDVALVTTAAGDPPAVFGSVLSVSWDEDPSYADLKTTHGIAEITMRYLAPSLKHEIDIHIPATGLPRLLLATKLSKLHPTRVPDTEEGYEG